ncbi:MAG: hypothetical protein GX050_09900 [Firmicutes bacterium]|nr:hypothetical protein [Bacillota bacterium]
MTISNLLSLSRLLLSPFIMVFFSQRNIYGVFTLWALAAITDFLDGQLARKRGEISDLGKILDPIADKMTLVFSFLSLMIWYKLPRWFGAIYITKELLQLTGGLILIRKKRKIIASNYWGKTSTFLFFVGLFLFSLDLEGSSIHSWGLIILSLGLFLSLVAFFTYSRNILKK